MRIKKLGLLFRDYQQQLYVSAIAITKNRELAEDAVHDALLSVAQVSTEPDDLKAYLFRVVRNKAIHCQKKLKREVSYSDEFIQIKDNSNEQQVFAAQIIKYIEQLSADQQQTLIMKLFGNLTFKEIAEITDNSPNTVASWYRRGLSVLQEKINDKP